MFKASS